MVFLHMLTRLHLLRRRCALQGVAPHKLSYLANRVSGRLRGQSGPAQWWICKLVQALCLRCWDLPQLQQWPPWSGTSRVILLAPLQLVVLPQL